MRFPWPAAFLADVILVVIFAWIGVEQHHGDLTLPTFAAAVWPFLAALAIGWIATLAWRAPAKPLRGGLPVWAVTVAGGMILRALTGGGTALPFVIVTAVTLLLFLVGWRVLAVLLRSARQPRR